MTAPLSDRLADAQTQAPRVPWDDFWRQLDWRQGEHFALIGPTGQGKTLMLTQLIPRRAYIAVFATKPRDTTMEGMVEPWWRTFLPWTENNGFVRYRQWRPASTKKFPRRIIWPSANDIDSDRHQSDIFEDAFARIYREGGWCIAIDEAWYICNMLGLAKQVRMTLLQGRSLGISMLVATQRPAHVPLEIYDQSTHLMFWRDNDETNLRRLGNLAFHQRSTVAQLVANLEQHQVLYLNTRKGSMMRTRYNERLAVNP